MSDRVGPVILSLWKPRKYLRENGEVFSFRTADRTTGETHYRTERTGGKVGDCHIEQVCPVYKWQTTWMSLLPYAERSGFSYAGAWLDAIKELHGEVPETGYIYRITKEGILDD